MFARSGKMCHHSDYIEILPEYLLKSYKYGVEIDIMIEAKRLS